MRLLLQPPVLGKACVAAAISAAASYPRLMLWQHQPAPLWYLEAIIFLCSIILWSFVFAWHEPYSGLPLFVLHPGPAPWLLATVAGIGLALINHHWLDPVLRTKFPEEYPSDWLHWLAAVLFLLAFNQLFAVFAPIDWLMRLTKNRWATATLTGLLAAGLLYYKTQKLGVTVPSGMLVAMLFGRLFAGFLVVWFYLRGGLALVWWWGLLLDSRLTLDLLK